MSPWPSLALLLLAWSRLVLAASEPLEPSFAWNAIGRVNVPHGFCTGTLVGPSEVLTAAHCLVDPRRHRIYDPDEIHFVAGWRRGSWVAHGRIAALRLAPDLALDTDGRPVRLESDWAVLRLERALLDLDLLQPLPVGWAGGRVDPRATLQLVGYGQDRPHLPVRVAPCPIVPGAPHASLLLHACLAAEGQSGAPLLAPAGLAWSVVGVHLGSILVDGRRVGVAVLVRRVVPESLFR